MDEPVSDLYFKNDKTSRKFIFISVMLGVKAMGEWNREFSSYDWFYDDYSNITVDDVAQAKRIANVVLDADEQAERIYIAYEDVALFYLLVHISARAFAFLDMPDLRRLTKMEHKSQEYSAKLKEVYLQSADELLRYLRKNFKTDAYICSELARLSLGTVSLKPD
jgi:hypothetical protein